MLGRVPLQAWVSSLGKWRRRCRPAQWVSVRVTGEDECGGGGRRRDSVNPVTGGADVDDHGQLSRRGRPPCFG